MLRREKVKCLKCGKEFFVTTGGFVYKPIGIQNRICSDCKIKKTKDILGEIFDGLK